MKSKRTSLLRQLLGIALLFLAVPLATPWVFRHASDALLNQQKEALSKQAEVIAATIDAGKLAPPHRGQHQASLYVWPTLIEQSLDGYASDWQDADLPMTLRLPAPWQSGAVARTQGGLAFWLQSGVAPRYCTPANHRPCTQIDLHYQSQGKDQHYRLRPFGPGIDTIRSEDGHSTDLRYYWHDRGVNGFQLEFFLPTEAISQLRVNVADNDNTVFLLPGLNPALPALASKTLSAGQRVRIIGEKGQLLSNSNSAHSREPLRWWETLLGRLMTPRRDHQWPPLDALQTQFDLRVSPFGSGQTRVWVTDSFNKPLTLVASTRSDNGIWVVLEEPAAAHVQLSRSIAGQWLGLGMMLILFVMLLLFGFGLRLVWRLRKLGRCLDDTLDEHGCITSTLPEPTGRDELDRLQAHMRDLLRRTQAQQDYLGALGKVLRHELRTPLAVMMNALENTPAEQSKELQQAKAAGQRLRQTLIRMAEAVDIEQAVSNIEPQLIAVNDFLQAARDNYRQAYPRARFEAEGLEHNIDCCTDPDLLAQALDKLVDNAVRHHQPGSAIILQVNKSTTDIQFIVKNASTQQAALDSEPHLGLGLLLVRRIAERLGGELLQNPSAGQARFGLSISTQNTC